MWTIFGLSLCFSCGLLLVQKPFFRLAENSVSLLNALLSEEENEKIKQLDVAAKLGGVLMYLAVFFLIVVFGGAMLNIFWPGDFLSLQGWEDLLAILIGGSIPFVVMSFLRKKTDYSPWSQLLHRLVLNNYAVSLRLFNWQRKRKLKKGLSPKTDFVIVSGLARSGTTALLHHLYETKAFHCLSYADMPFLLVPGLLQSRHQKPAEKRERSHEDGILVNKSSVEAFEEYFFKVQLHDSYIKETTLDQHELDQSTYQSYLHYQRLVQAPGTETTYLAKNNNLLLRYVSLRRWHENFHAIFLFREPLAHANSLLKQHLRFSQLQSADPFVLEYMDWLGHHEFGLNQKVFRLKDRLENTDYQKDTIEYWLWIWRNYYKYLLSLEDHPRMYWVHYEDLCQRPEDLLQALSQAMDLETKQMEILPFAPKDTKVEPSVDQSLLQQSLLLFEQLKSRALRF